jgi:hypothetical protein
VKDHEDSQWQTAPCSPDANDGIELWTVWFLLLCPLSSDIPTALIQPPFFQ